MAARSVAMFMGSPEGEEQKTAPGGASPGRCCGVVRRQAVTQETWATTMHGRTSCAECTWIAARCTDPPSGLSSQGRTAHLHSGLILKSRHTLERLRCL